MKQARIHCPYCGSLAMLRPASAIHGLSDISAGTYLCTSAAAGLPVMPMSQQTAARNSHSAPLPTEICGINAFLPTMHCTVYRHSLA